MLYKQNSTGTTSTGTVEILVYLNPLFVQNICDVGCISYLRFKF